MHKLLLADDSITIQRVIELTFSGEDVHVIAVSDGEQAIARIPTERPDIVLADIGMPKRSGYEVAAFVKGHPDFKHIPVLLLAGAFEPVDDAKASEAGCDGVLVKPFEPQHVISRVRELLDGGKGSPTQAAAATVARPVERLTRESGPATQAPPVPAPSNPESRVPNPGSGMPGVSPGNPDESLDDYFDRLDASFKSMGGKAASITLDPGDSDLSVPTLEKVLSPSAAPPAPANQGSITNGSFGIVGSAPKPVPPIDLPVNTPPVALTPLPTPIAPPSIEPPDTPSTLAPDVASRASDVASGFSRKAQPAGGRTLIADAFTALLALEQGEPGARPVRLTTGGEEPVATDALVDEVARRVLERLAPDAARAVIVEVVSEMAERLVREEIARIRSRQ